MRHTLLSLLFSTNLVGASVTCTGPGDWPTNVVFLSAAQNEAAFLQQDGVWHDLDNVLCLQEPAYACGACSSISFDHVEIAVGTGPCMFMGSSGSIFRVDGGTAATIGPPEALLSAICGPDV